MIFVSDLKVCIKIRIIIPVNTIWIISTICSKIPKVFQSGIYINASFDKNLARINITQILTYLNLIIKICSFFNKNSLVFSISKFSLLLEFDLLVFIESPNAFFVNPPFYYVESLSFDPLEPSLFLFFFNWKSISFYT